jgi:16S rRNA processing protein RimM
VSQSQNISEYLQIAQIIKPKGLKVQLVVDASSAGGELFLLPEFVGTEVWIVPPTMHGRRVGKIASVDQKPGSPDYIVSISGVDSLTSASDLAGRYLLAKTPSHPQTPTKTPCHSDRARSATRNLALTQKQDFQSQSAFSQSDITISFTDINAGNLGQLTRIDQTPSYDLWVVNGPHGELIIPAVEAYLVETTPELITLNLPKGFLEINKKAEQ